MIKVRLFGYLREKYGRDIIRLGKKPLTIGEIAAVLRDGHGVDVRSVRFAVNNEFVKGTYRVSGGATVDLIPPVAGG